MLGVVGGVSGINSMVPIDLYTLYSNLKDYCDYRRALSWMLKRSLILSSEIFPITSWSTRIHAEGVSERGGGFWECVLN